MVNTPKFNELLRLFQAMKESKDRPIFPNRKLDVAAYALDNIEAIGEELTTLHGLVEEYDLTGGHLYCTTCGSCGIEGCCPPGKCYKAMLEEAEKKLNKN